MIPTTPLRVRLRPVVETDLPIFFQQQLDPQANFMAAFTSKNVADRRAFDEKWTKILADPAIAIRTILANSQVAGYVAHHSWFGDPEVTYWLGRDFWGKGIATSALQSFLKQEKLRPLYGRVAMDNAASHRVLEKCGFILIGKERGFSNFRGEEIEELVLILRE
jgi:RimJ/RimL family protein N-acetyltransferase